MKVALVYDRVNKWGGAERVLLSLHKIYPEAPLFTSVYDSRSAIWAKVFSIKTSFLQNLPFVRNHNEIFPFLMPIAFESFSFEDYDLVISVTSEAAKGIIVGPKTTHICICLTPTRYLWSGFSHYFKNPIIKYLSSPVVSYLKKWDLVAAKRPDYYIAISNEVKKRIKKYYGQESKVIYPAVEISGKSKEGDGKYFLLVSRLSKFVSYKKVDLVVDAFNKLGYPLKVVGTGSLEDTLKNNAKENIEFLGFVPDERLWAVYKDAKALIFPAIEDFGLVMAEAQSLGVPVIALRAGGALEIVREGKTGEFFDDQNFESLINVLKNFDERRYNTKAIIQNSKRFSFSRFEKEIREFVKGKYKLK